jgi:PAS domain S-box-containing protein
MAKFFNVPQAWDDIKGPNGVGLEEDRRPTVLLADDEEQIIRLYKKLLEGKGYRVLCARDGREATEIVAGEEVDVALLDMRMPEIDGLGALRAIKEIDATIEVLIVTGYADIEDFREAIIHSGAYDYILKPFHPMEILHAVRNAMNKRQLLEQPYDRSRSFDKCMLDMEQEFVERTRQLRESQIKYKQIVENSNDIIAVTQRDAFKFVNRKMSELTGYAHEEIADIEPLALVHLHDRDRVRETIEGSDLPKTIQYRLLSKEDGFLWVEANCISTLWGEEPALMQFIRDITQRKQAETALKNTQKQLEKRVEERTAALVEANKKLQQEVEVRKRAEEQIQKSKTLLQEVFDGMLDPLILVGHKLEVKALNRAAAGFFDLEYQKVIDQPLALALADEFAAWEQYGVIEAMRQKQALVTEGKGVRRACKTFKFFVYPVTRAVGNQAGAILRLSDITEEKTMEKQLIQSEKLASLGLLVSGIAHEINNPNNFIVFNMPILRDYLQELRPVVEEYARSHAEFEISGMPYPEWWQDLQKLLDNMEHGASRINTTVSSLREFTKLRNSEQRAWIDTKTVVNNAVAICRGHLNKRVASFAIELADDLPQICGNAASLEQVLINLLINAAQAADKPDSFIKLVAKSEEPGPRRLVMEIIDNGTGIDEETMARIFEPFFTTKGSGSGTGLGLYISQNLVESLDGTIEVHSVPGEGSTFRLVFFQDEQQNVSTSEQ